MPVASRFTRDSEARQRRGGDRLRGPPFAQSAKNVEAFEFVSMDRCLVGGERGSVGSCPNGPLPFSRGEERCEVWESFFFWIAAL